MRHVPGGATCSGRSQNVQSSRASLASSSVRLWISSALHLAFNNLIEFALQSGTVFSWLILLGDFQLGVEVSLQFDCFRERVPKRVERSSMLVLLVGPALAFWVG